MRLVLAIMLSVFMVGAYAKTYRDPGDVLDCGVHMCTVHLKAEILENGNYYNLVHALRTANSGDTIVFLLHGNGGMVSGMMELVSAIKSSKAEVVMKLIGPVASAHSVLLVSGNRIEMTGNYLILVHRSHDTRTEETLVTKRDRCSSEMCRRVYDNKIAKENRFFVNTFGTVLTSSEMNRVLAGDDVVINSNRLR